MLIAGMAGVRSGRVLLRVLREASLEDWVGSARLLRGLLRPIVVGVSSVVGAVVVVDCVCSDLGTAMSAPMAVGSECCDSRTVVSGSWTKGCNSAGFGGCEVFAPLIGDAASSIARDSILGFFDKGFGDSLSRFLFGEVRGTAMSISRTGAGTGLPEPAGVGARE